MWLIATCLEGQAVIAAEEAQFTWAVQLWEIGDPQLETIRVPIPLYKRAGYERSIITARIRLGDQNFAVAWDAGHTMTPEQSIAG